MKNVKRILKQNFPEARKHDFLLWSILMLGVIIVGMVMTYFSFREGIDFGDGSTFFQFAHNLAHGEVIYKDFIHFRTPGSYFLYALFIHFFGDQQSSIRFALGFESHVLYTFFFTVAIAIFLRFKNILLGASTILLIFALPAYAQLRTVLALLAIVLYIQSYRVVKGRRLWMLCSGIFVGIAFTFGQEAGLMAILAIGLMELFQADIHDKLALLRRIGILAAGFFIGMLPLLLYVLLLSNIGTFLYYVFYYAFILQPEAMNLVYPSLDFGNLIYYLIFALYCVIFYIFYSTRKLGLIEGTLLVFALARLITLLGRSDIGHLIFVLPEVFFLTLFAILHLKDAAFNRVQFTHFVPYGAAFIASFYLAIHSSGVYIILSSIIVLLALRLRYESKKVVKTPYYAAFTVQGTIIVLLTLLVYIMYPAYMSTIDTMTKRGLTSVELGGVNVDQPVYDEVMAIKKTVNPIHPTTIFAYPIEAYYYNLAPKHASRLITFELETTPTEEDEAIQDLNRTRPEVIIYDPVQADSLSKPLGKINAYILDHYKILEVVNITHPLWVMVKK